MLVAACCSFFVIFKVTIFMIVVVQSPSVSSFTLTIPISPSTRPTTTSCTSKRFSGNIIIRNLQHQNLPVKSAVLFTSNPNSSQEEHPSKEHELLNDHQIDFTMGYLNKHHTDVLILFVQAFTQLGATQVKKNAFSGGSYEISNVKLRGIDYFGHHNVNGNEKDEDIDTTSNVGFLTLEAMVQIRSEKQPKLEVVTVPLGTFTACSSL